MLPQQVLFALVATVAAVPLNINLGAYSPALVVGDGEISVGEAKSASELMATLASGSNAAGAAGAAQGQQQQQQGQRAEVAAQPSQEKPAEGEAAAKRAPNLLRRAISDLISKRAPAPAAQEDKIAAIEAATEWIKRDLQGFQASLAYAREALKDQPKVELGSPGAGVGIVVNPGVNVPAGSAAAGATAKPAKKAKREEVADEAETPKMTLVAITEV
ncbi:hypothetical protein ACEQ8H_002161 [Pleosporales sp. CAS-2024a]